MSACIVERTYNEKLTNQYWGSPKGLGQVQKWSLPKEQQRQQVDTVLSKDSLWKRAMNVF